LKTQGFTVCHWFVIWVRRVLITGKFPPLRLTPVISGIIEIPICESPKIRTAAADLKPIIPKIARV